MAACRHLCLERCYCFLLLRIKSYSSSSFWKWIRIDSSSNNCQSRTKSDILHIFLSASYSKRVCSLMKGCLLTHISILSRFVPPIHIDELQSSVNHIPSSCFKVIFIMLVISIFFYLTSSRFALVRLCRSKSLTADGGVYGATGCTAFLSVRLFCGLDPQMCLERYYCFASIFFLYSDK